MCVCKKQQEGELYFYTPAARTRFCVSRGETQLAASGAVEHRWESVCIPIIHPGSHTLKEQRWSFIKLWHTLKFFARSAWE